MKGIQQGMKQAIYRPMDLKTIPIYSIEKPIVAQLIRPTNSMGNVQSY